MIAKPKISFIVSTYAENSSDVENKLLCCLYSLANQSLKEIEVIVTDNSSLMITRDSIRQMVYRLNMQHVNTVMSSCYHSAEYGAGIATGEYLCFPSDDSYYVPTFAETMYKAGKLHNADLVYCDIVYDSRCGQGRYERQHVLPTTGSIDKTGFILKRDKFIGFPTKTEDGRCNADGEMISILVNSGISHAHIPDVLLVHN